MDAIGKRRCGRNSRGGIRRAADVRAAALLCALGLDGWRLLTTSDAAESLALQAMAQEAVEIARARDKALAGEIASAVSRLFR